MMADMRKRGQGSIQTRNGRRYVRASLPNGKRPWLLLPGKYQPGSAAEGEAAAELVELVASRITAELARAEQARATVQSFGEAWTSGALYRAHGQVRGLRPKASATQDAYRLAAYVYPRIGPVPVADVTEVHIEEVMAAAPALALEARGKAWTQGSRRQLYQVLRRLFDLAIRPGRLREDNPVSEDLKPARGAPKLYGWLYPSELLTLLACVAVPPARRVLYALATYTGLRKGSLLPLEWPCVDFVHGTLLSRTSKTGLPQLFEAGEVVELLARWHEHQGRPRSGHVIGDTGAREDREAETLRADLLTAGVDRASLHERSAAIEPIRFHDLRATFVTWSLHAGRGLGWITDRTGHITEEQMRRYARQARTLADLRYTPFPRLDEAMPDLRLPANVVRGKFGGRGT